MSLKPTFIPTSSELSLKEASLLDSRSDDEIAAYIQSDRPVSTLKNVWSFWHSGWDVLPGWRKRNVINWVRCLGSSWEVRVLDAVPGSHRHISRFIPDDLLPIAVRENRMTGIFAPQHTAEWSAFPLCMFTAGSDIGLLLLRNLDDVCWNALVDPSNPHEVCGIRFPHWNVSGMLNGFIAALPRNPFLLNWHRPFLAVWGDRTDATDISQHPLIAPFDYRAGAELEKSTGIRSQGNYISDYIGHMMCFDRLLAIEDLTSGFFGHAYWTTHFRLLPVNQIFSLYHLFDRENGSTEEETIKLLALKRVVEPVPHNDPAQAQAKLLVEWPLAHAVCKKISSGPWQNPLGTVAGQWNAVEGGNGDIVPDDTWAAYLRWGSVHLKPKREDEVPVHEEAELSPAEGGILRPVYRVGLFDPIVPGVTSLVQGEVGS